MEKNKVRYLFERDHISGELSTNYGAFLLLNHHRKKVMIAADAVISAEKAIALAADMKHNVSKGSGQIKTERNGKSEIVVTTNEEILEMLKALLFTREQALDEALRQFNAIDLSIIADYDLEDIVDEIGGEQHDTDIL